MTSEEIKDTIRIVTDSEHLSFPERSNLRGLYEIAYQLAVGNEQRSYVKALELTNQQLADKLAALVRADSGSEVLGGCPFMNRPCAFCGRPWDEHRDGQLVDDLASIQRGNTRTTLPNSETTSIQPQEG